MATTYYLFHLKGSGQFTMPDDTGVRCMLLFTSEQSLHDFVKLMETPEHNNFLGIPFDTESLIAFLSKIRTYTPFVAIDPPTKSYFTAIHVDYFLDRLREGRDV